MSTKEIKLGVQQAAKRAAEQMKADGYCGQCPDCLVSLVSLSTLFLRAVAREYGIHIPADVIDAAVARRIAAPPLPPSGGCVN